MHRSVVNNKITLIVLILELVFSANVSDSLEVSNEKVLSRRKRYLVFPDGSTLQLVFCVQTSALITIGDIFLFGNTAALAWTLPSDPDFFLMVKEHYKAQRRQDLNEIFYLDEEGRIIAKAPYKKKTLISPVFAKRSVTRDENENMSFKEKLRLKLDRKKMHEEQKNREYLNQKHMSIQSMRFHRSSRIDLYEKLEKLLTALGRDGRACVLQKLCESKRPANQGTFLQEVARILFTLPKSNDYVNEEHRNYDRAHHDSFGDCQTLYPDCKIDTVKLF